MGETSPHFCDALNPGDHFFFLLDKSVVIEKSLSQQKSSVARASLVVCAPRALSPYLCHARIPIRLACLSCAPGSVVGERTSWSCTAECICRACCVSVVHACARAACLLCTPCLVCRVCAWPSHTQPCCVR